MPTPSRPALPVLIATALAEHWSEARLRELLAEAGGVIHGLEGAIRTHRDQKAEDRCIEDDDRLYEALGDGIKCDRRVGDPAAMLANCARFIERRCEGGGWPSYRELEAEVERLRAEVKRLRVAVDGYEGFRVGPLASEE